MELFMLFCTALVIAALVGLFLFTLVELYEFIPTRIKRLEQDVKLLMSKRKR